MAAAEGSAASAEAVEASAAEVPAAAGKQGGSHAC